MASTFSSDSSQFLNDVSLEINNKKSEGPDIINISEHYELQKCARWIEENGFTKVSLQFPDELLQYADVISMKLQDLSTNTHIYVLADTSYSSCCVDEVAAEHVSSEAIVHFGPACLTPCNRLPVLYVFGKEAVNVTQLVEEFRRIVSDTTVNALLLYDVTYSHVSDEIYESLHLVYPNLRSSELVIPSNDRPPEVTASASTTDNSRSVYRVVSARKIDLKPGLEIKDHVLFYVGREGPALTKLLMTLNRNRLISYDPRTLRAREESAGVNRSLRKRYYAVEKARDARIIGILMGTLGVAGYLDVVRRLREVAAAAGKKTYTIAVGKLNPAKLANFPEIDAFVLVACPDNTIVDSKEFYRPIVTPFEFELACVEDRTWTGEYVTDFKELMPGARHYVPLSGAVVGAKDSDRTSVSLITGKLSALSAKDASDQFDSEERAVAIRSDAFAVAEIHNQAAGEFLTNRSWRGLDPAAASPATETPAVIRQGARGIASSYEHENPTTDAK